MFEEEHLEPQESGEEESRLSDRDALKVDLYFWLQALVMALVGLILVFTFIGRIIGVDGSSMMPTLHDHDMLLLQSIGYTPESGDVVVLSKKSFREGQPIVKRVIAVGGQTVDIDYESNTVYVDGVVLDAGAPLQFRHPCGGAGGLYFRYGRQPQQFHRRPQP